MVKVYVFIGKYNGIIDVIKVFHSKMSGISAWEEYTSSLWIKTPEADNSMVLTGGKFEGTVLTEAVLEENIYTKQYAGFTIEDAMSICPDLTEEQATNVLKFADKHFDAYEGLTWQGMKNIVKLLYPNLKCEEDNDEEDDYVE